VTKSLKTEGGLKLLTGYRLSVNLRGGESRVRGRSIPPPEQDLWRGGECRSMKNTAVRFALLSCLLAPTARAVPILGVTASTTSTTFVGTSILDTANGSGLAPGQVSTATHATSAPGIFWATGDAAASVNLTFNLAGLRNLAGMAIWNVNNAFNNNGINGVLVSSSTDGVIFNPIAGAPAVFAQGPAAGPSLADGIFAWTPVAATHVRFNVASNHGGAFVAFNEVLFDEAAAGAPEIGRQGAMAPLLIVAMTLLCLRRGRQPELV